MKIFGADVQVYAVLGIFLLHYLEKQEEGQ